MSKMKEQKIGNKEEKIEFTAEQIEKFKSEQAELVEFKNRTEKEQEIVNKLFELKKSNSNLIDNKPVYLNMPEYYKLLLELEELNLKKSNYFYEQELLKLNVRIKSYDGVFEEYENKNKGELNE
jgi:hypothetical protein